MGEHTHDTTDANFEADVLNSELPVLIDFWAPWCGPCKAVAPVLEEVAAELAGKLKVVKVNVDDNSETPAKYGVRGIPTLIIFKGGENVATKVGALSKPELLDFINEHL